MFRQFCSLYLLQRRVNDNLRSTASASAAASLKGDGTEFITGEPPSHKMRGPSYSVLGPDPCEDPERVYVDIVVSILQTNNIQVTKEWELFSDKLRKLGPWIDRSGIENNGEGEEDGDENEDGGGNGGRIEDREAHRRKMMKKLSFVGREDPVAVDLPTWRENSTEFARRLTLKELCDLIVECGCIKSKEELFDFIFEEPWEIKEAADVRGMANRSKFTKESLIDWFFEFDTYSKCVVFFEAVNWYLKSQASPISLVLDDIYCCVFSYIRRQTFLTRAKNPSLTVASSFSPTPDTKLLAIDECVQHFLKSDINISQMALTERDCFFPLLTEMPRQQKKVNTFLDTMKRPTLSLLPSTSSSSSSNNKRKRNTAAANILLPVYRSNFSTASNNKRLKTDDGENASACILIEGYANGKISPIRIMVRKSTIIPEVFNHLLFPVFASKDTGANILFFIKMKSFASASLLLPGLFRHPKQFLNGPCKWMTLAENNINDNNINSSTMWSYTLADYCPLGYYTQESPQPYQTCGNFTSTTNKRLQNVQPLYF
ncbi:ORF183 [White spot syndrome virus]|uniref:Wsv415 n=8 Tax=White spot syndrome virus TaxID=342409 RepID=Q77J06_WSSVS